MILCGGGFSVSTWLLLERAYRDASPLACVAPMLFLLEEFHSLGHMAVVEKAAGYAAGFGVKLWAVLQDIQPCGSSASFCARHQRRIFVGHDEAVPDLRNYKLNPNYGLKGKVLNMEKEKGRIAKERVVDIQKYRGVAIGKPDN